jgi:hypothetical protein
MNRSMRVTARVAGATVGVIVVAAALALGALVVRPTLAEATPSAGLLYVSGTDVYQWDGVTASHGTLFRRAPVGQVYRQPHRSLDGRGAAWFAENTVTGDIWVQYVERVTVPGTDTLHEIRASMTDVQGGPRVSPDGSRLLYGTEVIDPVTEMLTMHLEVYDAATAHVVDTIPNGEDGDWSPDGRYIAYMDYERAGSDPLRVALYVYDTVSGTSRAVSTVKLAKAGEIDVYRPRWSPDGAWISVTQINFASETTSALLTDPAGTFTETWVTRPAGEMGLGMGWMWAPVGPSRLFVETVVPGGAPYWVSEIVTAGAVHALAPRLLHGALSQMPARSFIDVLPSPSHHFFAEIMGLADRRIADGVSETQFGPDRTIKRAQFAKVITNAMGLHDGTWTNWGNPSFSDVPQPSVQTDPARYPFDYVEEAAAAGIVKGTAGMFNPYADITRVQLALMISRAAAGKLVPPSPAALAVFSDLQGLSAEARQAIALCYENDIINGKTATTFVPYGHATRGQAAKMTWGLLLALGVAE